MTYSPSPCALCVCCPKIKEEQQSDDDDLSDDTSVYRPRCKTHTAKTAPPRLRVQRYNTDDDEDEDDDDDDCRNLKEHHPRRQIRTGVPTRREMLVQKRREEQRALESDYDKAETFLRKLRHEASKDQTDEFRKHVTKREFTAFLLRKVRGHSVHGDWFTRRQWKGEGEGERPEEGERKWANSRLDTGSPMKRLGNIASLFQRSGRNTPAGEGAPGRGSSWATQVAGAGNQDPNLIRSSSSVSKACSTSRTPTRRPASCHALPACPTCAGSGGTP
ncbi:hypothetical protein ACOMHN_019468 [Nucella lapillus]